MGNYMAEDDPQLVDIRRRAQDHGNAEEWSALVDMAEELRRDAVFWPDIWAPILAVALARTGRDGALAVLDEAIAAGFSQPELHEPELTECFADTPDWNLRVERMRRNVPAPPVTLLDWPRAPYGPPLGLGLLMADRTAALRELVPAAEAGSWQTAVALLAWVSARWRHANAHVDGDAVEVLRRVEAGERFACVEYSTVLSQALCVRDIPARSVALQADNPHTGLAKGHVVTEAWIDELGKWVVLDGQNGMYWVDERDEPAGLPELIAAGRSGAAPWRHRCVDGKDVDDAAAAGWWSYFHSARSGGAAWGEDGYVPVFQTEHVAATRVLLREPGELYPDLSDMRVAVVAADGSPAVEFHSVHPFGIGWVLSVDGVPVAQGRIEDPWSLPVDAPTGEYTVAVSTVTRYRILPARTLRYRIG